MIYVFDLDGTLCRTHGRDYERAEPLQGRINLVNSLYAQGHEIIIDTARGSVTGEDWQARTEAQLDQWGVKRHRVRTGVKIYADVYVDDKAVHDDAFFGELSQEATWQVVS